MFDGIEVNHQDVTDTHQGQVFNHFISQGAGSYYKNLGVSDLVAFPPGDELEGAQAVSF